MATFLFQGRGAVAGPLHRFNDLVDVPPGIRPPAHSGAARFELHQGASHTGDALNGLGHLARAVLAIHPADGELRNKGFARGGSPDMALDVRVHNATAILPPLAGTVKFALTRGAAFH